MRPEAGADGEGMNQAHPAAVRKLAQLRAHGTTRKLSGLSREDGTRPWDEHLEGTRSKAPRTKDLVSRQGGADPKWEGGQSA